MTWPRRCDGSLMLRRARCTIWSGAARYVNVGDRFGQYMGMGAKVQASGRDAVGTRPDIRSGEPAAVFAVFAVLFDEHLRGLDPDTTRITLCCSPGLPD